MISKNKKQEDYYIFVKWINRKVSIYSKKKTKKKIL